jgi:hypothetical protein
MPFNKLGHKSKNPKFPQNLRPISLLSTTGKLFEKVILKIFQRHIEEKSMLNASQFCFLCPSEYDTDNVTLNFNNNISTAAVFLDIEKNFDKTWNLGLVYKLSTLQFSISLIKLVYSFLSKTKFIVSVEGEMSPPRNIQGGVLYGCLVPHIEEPHV